MLRRPFHNPMAARQPSGWGERLGVVEVDGDMEKSKSQSNLTMGLWNHRNGCLTYLSTSSVHINIHRLRGRGARAAGGAGRGAHMNTGKGDNKNDIGMDLEGAGGCKSGTTASRYIRVSSVSTPPRMAATDDGRRPNTCQMNTIRLFMTTKRCSFSSFSSSAVTGLYTDQATERPSFDSVWSCPGTAPPPLAVYRLSFVLTYFARFG